LVGFDASVAKPPVTGSDQPGDGPFHHGPPLAVVVGEFALDPCPAGGYQLVVVFGDVEDPDHP